MWKPSTAVRIAVEWWKLIETISYWVHETEYLMHQKQHYKSRCLWCVFQSLSQAIQQCENNQQKCGSLWSDENWLRPFHTGFTKQIPQCNRSSFTSLTVCDVCFNHFRKQSNNVGTINRSADCCGMMKIVRVHLILGSQNRSINAREAISQISEFLMFASIRSTSVEMKGVASETEWIPGEKLIKQNNGSFTFGCFKKFCCLFQREKLFWKKF